MVAPVISTTTYGLDASLTHGALVAVEWSEGLLTDARDTGAVRRLLTWDKNGGLHDKSSFKDLELFARQIAAHMYNTGPMLADLDANMVYWSKRSRSVFLVGHMLGVLNGLLRGAVSFERPADVRVAFGLKPGASKLAVWESFNKQVTLDGMESYNEDERDAVILATLARRHMHGNDARTSATLVSCSRTQTDHAERSTLSAPTTSRVINAGRD